MENQGWYEFSHFRLDLETRLLFRGDEVVSLTPKAFELLLILIERQGQLVKYEDLKKLVWKESKFVEDKTLTQTVYTLRASLGDNSTEQKYIENVPKRGYRFVNNAVFKRTDAQKSSESETPPAAPVSFIKRLFPFKLERLSIRYILIGIFVLSVLTLGVAIGFLLSKKNSSSSNTSVTNQSNSQEAQPVFENKSAGRSEISSPSDEAEIKKLVETSQTYESLTMYVSPNDFDERKLLEYWLPEELGGKEIVKVKTSLKRLRDKQLRYGGESRLERFEVRYVRVFSPRDYAEMGTVERWFLPMYRADGSRVEGRNEYLGPYKVDYALRKIGDRWLIEETSTPRYEERK